MSTWQPPPPSVLGYERTLRQPASTRPSWSKNSVICSTLGLSPLSAACVRHGPYASGLNYGTRAIQDGTDERRLRLAYQIAVLIGEGDAPQ